MSGLIETELWGVLQAVESHADPRRVGRGLVCESKYSWEVEWHRAEPVFGISQSRLEGG